MNSVIQMAQKQSGFEEEIRKQLTEAYAVKENNPDYQTLAAMAVDCGVRIYNILRSARKNTGVLAGYLDLVVGLNSNLYWQKHGAALLPLLHTALQAQADYGLLMMEKLDNPQATHSDGLITESQMVGIELFVTIAYTLGGQPFMALKSIEIKKRLAPYFMD